MNVVTTVAKDPETLTHTTQFAELATKQGVSGLTVVPTDRCSAEASRPTSWSAEDPSVGRVVDDLTRTPDRRRARAHSPFPEWARAALGQTCTG